MKDGRQYHKNSREGKRRVLYDGHDRRAGDKRKEATHRKRRRRGQDSLKELAFNWQPRSPVKSAPLRSDPPSESVSGSYVSVHNSYPNTGFQKLAPLLEALQANGNYKSN